MPASYANGFAPRDGQPLYPSLWRGCVGAWNPGLGPTGLTLRDWSAFKNHGTLVNSPIWAPNKGCQSLTFNGTNNYCVTTHSVPTGDIEFTLSAWVQTVSNSSFGSCISIGNINPVAGGACIFLNLSTGSVSLEFGGNVGYRVSNTLTVGRRYHICFTKTKGAINATTIGYLDGIPMSVSSAASNTPNIAAGVTYIGATFTSIIEYFASAIITDVGVWGRALKPNEVKTLSIRPGIAYELAPRRRSSSAVQFNRRRRLLLGAS